VKNVFLKKSAFVSKKLGLREGNKELMGLDLEKSYSNLKHLILFCKEINQPYINLKLPGCLNKLTNYFNIKASHIHKHFSK
jgi:hypothetical protein